MKSLNLTIKAGYLGAAVACAALMGLSGTVQATTTTTTTLTPSTYTPSTNQDIAFTMHVKANGAVFGPSSPTGTVYFLVDGQVRKTAWIDYSNRTPVFHYKVNCDGNRTFSAIFTGSGDPFYLASQSPNLTITVLPGASFGPGGCGDNVW